MVSIGTVQTLTFVSMTGPTLDVTSAKQMRAHTTRANFARRRKRMVQEYHEQQEQATRVKSTTVIENRQLSKQVQPIPIQPLVLKQPSAARKLREPDALLIDDLVHRLGKLHLTAEDLGLEDTQLMVWKSDWVRFLAFDPMMLDVSLYFAVYAARMKNHALKSAMEIYKGRAIRSVRQRLDIDHDTFNDSTIAAILLLTVTDQVTVNIEGWKMHITGLVKIIEIRSRDKVNPPTHWIALAIPRTVLQGLILFTRRDPTVLAAIEKTGMLDTMFTPPAKEAVYLILESAEKIADLTESHIKNDTLSSTEIASTKQIVASLDAAGALSLTGSEPEAFLATIALSMKIYVDFTIQHTTAQFRTDTSPDVIKLIEILEQPEQRLCSSLALCSSLGLVFWIVMMGAIASNDPKSKAFFMHRLEKTTVALSLATWQDAEAFLSLFAYIPNVLAVPCFEILDEVLCRKGFVLVATFCIAYLEKYKKLRYGNIVMQHTSRVNSVP